MQRGRWPGTARPYSYEYCVGHFNLCPALALALQGGQKTHQNRRNSEMIVCEMPCRTRVSYLCRSHIRQKSPADNHVSYQFDRQGYWERGMMGRIGSQRRTGNGLQARTSVG